MAVKTNTIDCKQCGHVNEGERIYCHNCGTKLDRSLLPTDKKPEKSLAKEQKRIRKIVSPSRGIFAGSGKMLVSTLLWAVLAAAVIQIARPPDNVPAEIKKDDLLGDDPIGFRNKLEGAMHSPVPVKLTLKEADINHYLQYTVKSKAGGLIGDEVKFIRLFVNLDEGVCRITTQQSLFGYSLYGSASYRLAIGELPESKLGNYKHGVRLEEKDQLRNNQLQATNVGGRFGRLPVDPQIMKYLDIVFQKQWNALSNDKKRLDGFQSIEVHKGRIDLISKPAT